MNSEYQNNGFFLLENAINEDEVKTLIDELSLFEKDMNKYGIRDLMNKIPCIRQFALSASLLPIAKEILGEQTKPVRAVLFDKVPSANWNVAWHQDTSIAVKRKEDVPGFGPWTEKQGVVHVEPPEEYLAKILTLRIHLDTANTESGVLRIIPKTHRNGRIGSKKLLEIVDNSVVKECMANPGDILLMNPLLFHASRKATNPGHRRIIHIEYSAMTLPEPLEWYECS